VKDNWCDVQVSCNEKDSPSVPRRACTILKLIANRDEVVAVGGKQRFFIVV